MQYPKVLSEDETIDRALAGASLARYGDGELRVALGGGCISQIGDPALAKELRAALTRTDTWLPCIPNVYSESPKRDAWLKYAHHNFTRLYTGKDAYGSSFITRPDSAPWIDRPDYWEKVRRFWDGKDVVLAIGTERSLRLDMLEGARSVRVVLATRRDSYAEIDRIEAEIGVPPAGTPVLMCIGCTATVLAMRLALKGVHALDLGHIGMFMRARGAFGLKLGDLITDEYRQQNIALHTTGKGWGTSGHKQVDHIIDFMRNILKPPARIVLDYGAGRCTLATAIQERTMKSKDLRVWNYDPAVPGLQGMPKVAELVACTDVLEHVEPDKLDNVLKHIYGLADRGAFFQIATRQANRSLNDGRNAHLIVENAEWWKARLGAYKWTLIREEGKEGHDVRLWYLKPGANAADTWHAPDVKHGKGTEETKESRDAG